ncbi:MAG TPA: tetratricopeptide repeat protein [Kineosporiaceae bacterium]
MSNQPGRPQRPAIDLRGAVDLSALAARRPAPANGASTRAAAGAPATAGSATPGAAPGLVIDVTDATFMTEVIEQSRTVPVVVDFWAEWCQPCKQLSPVLERLAAEYQGAFLLAKIDVDANPQLGQAFQVQSIPAVFAVLKGQPVPLFQGAQPEAQIRAVLTELLRVAAANGVDGRVEAGGGAEAAVVDEPELPPELQAAYHAVDEGDLPGAVAAFEAALKQNPADQEARLGLAQVRLLERAQGVDVAQARAAAARDPQDVDAQLLVADLDLLAGHVDDAFGRLIETVRVTSGPDRERTRARLVELFDLVGPGDPRVAAGRTALARVLF